MSYMIGIPSVPIEIQRIGIREWTIFLDEFYFRWWENSVIKIGKATSVPLIVNYLNWNLLFIARRGIFLEGRNEIRAFNWRLMQKTKSLTFVSSGFFANFLRELWKNALYRTWTGWNKAQFVSNFREFREGIRVELPVCQCIWTPGNERRIN